MPDYELIGRLGVWEGYEVASFDRREPATQGSSPEVWIELRPVTATPMVCDGCGECCSSVHDQSERIVRDLPIFDAKTFLRVWRRRVLCPGCGPRLERLSWLDRYARVTARLAESVARLCQVMTIKHVAAFFGLGWDAVKLIDQSALERKLGEPDLDGLEVIGMDEFAIEKGHRYATVIVDPRCKRVLWVGRGRDREGVRAFYELLGPERCKKLKAIAMDMHGPFIEEAKLHCPQAELVFDLFHIVAKYGREVIDRVRVDEANRLRHDKKARFVVKSARWLLLRNKEHVKGEDKVRLREILDANRALCTTYVLRDDLKQLWAYRYEASAQRFWNEWYSRAVRSRIEPLKRFAMKLKPYLPGILAHCRWPLNTSLLEGINNRIKVIKRMAYGFRDDAYFFLKIRAAFPGNLG